MRTLTTCLGLCSFALLGTAALAQVNNLTDVTSPTEVGTTTIPSGTYLMTDESTGKAYPLVITKKGTMVLGPAGSATKELTSRKPGIKQSLEHGVTNAIEREGVGGLENFIK
jgi:hypothetical protein